MPVTGDPALMPSWAAKGGQGLPLDPEPTATPAAGGGGGSGAGVTPADSDATAGKHASPNSCHLTGPRGAWRYRAPRRRRRSLLDGHGVITPQALDQVRWWSQGRTAVRPSCSAEGERAEASALFCRPDDPVAHRPRPRHVAPPSPGAAARPGRRRRPRLRPRGLSRLNLFTIGPRRPAPPGCRRTVATRSVPGCSPWEAPAHALDAPDPLLRRGDHRRDAHQ